MRVLLSMFIVAAGIFATQAARAQSTVFELSMSFVYDRLPLFPYPGIRNNVAMTVTLSGKNDIATTGSTRVGPFANNVGGSSTLGATGARGPAWRVINANTLQASINFPASTRLMTLTVTGGNSCRVSVVDRLKPGARDYMFIRLDTGTMGYFTKPELVSSSCTVR